VPKDIFKVQKALEPLPSTLYTVGLNACSYMGNLNEVSITLTRLS
jgi:hypothetical protein